MKTPTSAPKTIDSIALSPANVARCKKIAEILEIPLDEYVDQVLTDFLEDIYNDGRVFELEVNNARLFSTRERALRIATNARSFDQQGNSLQQRELRAFQVEGGSWMVTDEDDE